MPSVARGTSAGMLLLLLVAGNILLTGCVGTKDGSSYALVPPQTPPAAVPFTTPPVWIPPQTSPPRTPQDLSLPPPKATPLPGPAVDPIVGTWYAPVPDDLTFVFFPDGTFTERSSSFRTTYRGTWDISEEGEEGFYDATILDRWGFQREVHILYTSGTLSIKSMGTLHRVG